MKKTVLTGYEIFDKDFGGLKSGEITLIGGRPGMGKTLIVLQIVLNVARSGGHVIFFTAGIGPTELELRLISMVTGIPFMKIRGWNLTDLEWDLFKKATIEIKNLPIQVIYADNVRMMRHWCDKTEAPVDLIIFDYLQLIHKNIVETKDCTPDLTPVEYLRELKRIAKKHKAPMIVLTQLSRNLERRKDKHPRIKDIRVKNLSADAYDQAFLLYREAYYNIDAPRNKAEIIGISEKKGIKKTREVLWNPEKGML